MTCRFRGACLFLIGAAGALMWAQDFGPPPKRDPNAPTVAMPSAFPTPGTYATTNSVTLLSATPGVQIHYTFDGTRPTAASPVFDPNKVLWVSAINDHEKGLKTGYTIRAVGMKPGMNDSDIATFQYTIDRRNTTEYVSAEILPGVTMIRDYADDKMFLIRGSRKALLIDSGMGTCKLREYITRITGSVPIEVLFTHFHGDHTGQSDQLIAESVEYINDADRAQVEAILKRKGAGADVIARNLRNIKDGDVLDLGDRKFIVYQVPGHTPGSVVALEEATGYLFTGDSVGSNGPGIPDSFWLFSNSSPAVDVYLSTLEVFRSKLKRPVTRLMSGHNDHPLEGEGYLDNLQKAAQTLVDRGTDVLVPSLRPAGYSQVVIGDRLTDPNWVSINVTKDRCLTTTPDKLATLSNIVLSDDQRLGFAPNQSNYSETAPKNTSSIHVTATTTSTRSRLKINGIDAKSGVAADVPFSPPSSPISITVTAPDGSTSQTYTVSLTK